MRLKDEEYMVAFAILLIDLDSLYTYITFLWDCRILHDFENMCE